ncbi:MAG: hypothetical protein ACHQXA_02005 [Gemmatimonadales bacterium]
MSARTQSIRLLQVAAIVVAVSCVGTVAPLLGQQIQGPIQAAPASSAPITAPAPQPSPLFERSEREPAGSRVSAAASSDGATHTFSISTLALVLGVIIIVLLLVR